MLFTVLALAIMAACKLGVQVLGTDPGNGASGTGTTLQGSSTGVLGMITKVGIAGQESAEIDITTMNASGNWKTFIAGLKDAKELSIELVYHKINMATIIAAVGGANETWTVTFGGTGGSTFVNSGHIKNLGTAIPNGDKITQTLTIRLSGPPTWHSASGSGI